MSKRLTFTILDSDFEQMSAVTKCLGQNCVRNK